VWLSLPPERSGTLGKLDDVDDEYQDKRLATIATSVWQYLRGIEATASVFPMGALHLAASLIDALARLTGDEKGGDMAQYEWFVRRYLPSAYHVDDLPRQLYAGLRSVGLHNLSVGRRLALMDGQLDRDTHLRVDRNGRRIIRVEEFLGDLRAAVNAWARDVNEHGELKRRVVKRTPEPGVRDHHDRDPRDCPVLSADVELSRDWHRRLSRDGSDRLG
jgi:hypothetical protein